MAITIYTLTYNEELIVKFMIDHYRARFPGCRIIVYDNLSNDDTVKIAKENGCEVVEFDTGGRFSDRRHMEIKDNCWKDAKTDWVLVTDIDELIDMNARQLKEEEKSGSTIIRTEGWNMVAMNDSESLSELAYGERDPGEDKAILFNKKFISEMNYSPGAHQVSPVGRVVYSKKAYKLFNYCYPGYDLTVKRYQVFAERKRKSPEDVQMGWGGNFETPEEIRDIYKKLRVIAMKIKQ